MTFSRNFLISLTIASTMLCAGMIAITHTHFEVGPKSGEASIVATCPCAAHQSSNSDSELPSKNESDSCLICRLIAELQADTPHVIEMNMDSTVSELCLRVETSVFTKPIRFFQGRAPPAC